MRKGSEKGNESKGRKYDLSSTLSGFTQQDVTMIAFLGKLLLYRATGSSHAYFTDIFYNAVCPVAFKGELRLRRRLNYVRTWVSVHRTR